MLTSGVEVAWQSKKGHHISSMHEITWEYLIISLAVCIFIWEPFTILLEDVLSKLSVLFGKTIQVIVSTDNEIMDNTAIWENTVLCSHYMSAIIQWMNLNYLSTKLNWRSASHPNLTAPGFMLDSYLLKNTKFL